MSGPARVRSSLAVIVPPIVLGVGFIALWQAWVQIKDVKPFIIPKPTAIIDALREDPALVVKASIVTGVNALVGLGFGSVLGYVVAVLTDCCRLVGDLVNPLAVT